MTPPRPLASQSDRSRKVRLSGLLFAAVIAASPVFAQTGEQRIPVCLACHGAGGTAQLPGTPSLGAQPADYVLVQLYLFREKQRVVAPMNAMAEGLTDDDLRTVSDAISKLPPPTPASDALDAATLERGQALAAKHRCVSCHNTDFSGHDQIPRLAGQREDYLRKSLIDYKSNSRSGYDATMNELTQELPDAEIPVLAKYLSHYK